MEYLYKTSKMYFSNLYINIKKITYNFGSIIRVIYIKCLRRPVLMDRPHSAVNLCVAHKDTF